MVQVYFSHLLCIQEYTIGLRSLKIQFALFTPTAHQAVTQIQVEPTAVLLKGLGSPNY